ncbi:MAG: AAA family ATPase, partial [Deinococcales bacterium]
VGPVQGRDQHGGRATLRYGKRIDGLEERRSIDPRIHHVDQVNRITGLRVLTKLPRKASRSKDYRSAMGLMAARLLLELPQRTSPPVVLVAGLEGGRTRPLSATHLAFAFARNGRRTLLIDANDQAPTLTEVFRLDPAGTTTFTQVLRAPDATVRPARIEGPTGASIDVIPNFGAGSTPRRLIDESLPSVLLGARERYDVIVVDTPPLLQSVNALAVAQSGTATVLVAALHRTHALAVAQSGTATVLVAALHRTHAPALRDAATTLGRTPAAVLGVAVADPSRGPWHFQRVLAWSGSRRSARSVAVDWRS